MRKLPMTTRLTPDERALRSAKGQPHADLDALAPVVEAEPQVGALRAGAQVDLAALARSLRWRSMKLVMLRMTRCPAFSLLTYTIG